MWIIPFVAAFAAWCLCGALGNSIFHHQTAAFLSGVIGATWAFWFVHNQVVEAEGNLLNPTPRKYSLTEKQVLALLTDYFAERSTSYGASWRPRTVDQQAGRLVYGISWVEEIQSFETDNNMNIRQTTKRYPHFVEAEITCSVTGDSSTKLQVKFGYETKNVGTCFEFIRQTTTEIDRVLGYGVEIQEEKHRPTLNPLIPAIIHLFLLAIIANCFFTEILPARFEEVRKQERLLEEAKRRYEDERRRIVQELEEWERSKRQEQERRNHKTHHHHYHSPEVITLTTPRHMSTEEILDWLKQKGLIK